LELATDTQPDTLLVVHEALERFGLAGRLGRFGRPNLE
jgi:hypothetical protein